VSIKATHESYTYQSNGEIKFGEFNLFPTLSRSAEIYQTPSIVSVDPLLDFTTLKSNLDKYFNKWFEIEERFEPVVQLFFGVVDDPNMYSYQTFSSLIQSLEVYHRRKHPENTQYEKNEFEAIKKSLVDFVSEKYKNWISKVLKFSNEVVLMIRLQDLIGKNSLIEKFFENEDKIKSFIFKIKNTRDYITHYNPDLKNGAARGLQLYQINAKMYLFVQIYLLSELGFDNNQIEKFLRKVNSYEKMIMKD
jgi:hypothetical protein